MAMDGSGLSASDVLALTKDNDGLFGGGNAGGILALIIVFILLFGNGGWGGYNRENVATQGEVQRSFDTNTIINKLDGITNGLCDGFYATNNSINGVNMNTMQGFNSVNQGINSLGYQMQQCCCENLRANDSLKYENAQNTCAIVNAIHADGEATRALMQANTVQELRDKIQDQQNTISNFMQTQNILNSIGRYVTNPPCYQNYGYGNYGCGCGATIA